LAESDILFLVADPGIMRRVRRRSESPLDQKALNGLIAILMRIDAKLERVLRLLEEEKDGEEEEAEPWATH